MHHASETVMGFVFRKVTPFEPARAVAYEIEHVKSGARILHLHAADPENMFSVFFPTPPPNDTGLPHILEHAVLSGSRRFPVRDPFFEMLKMSMATFINAMTGGHYTCYPVSSNVRKDLFNLAEVYFDAVFHPLLTRDTFRREGHHLAPADKSLPAGELTITGVVYNEMQGHYSSPEGLLGGVFHRELFRDSVYGRDSGGDPLCIPDLTWEQLRAFHREFYHPSNARFVFYGDIPTTDYLAFLDERLNDFDRRDVRPLVDRVPRWRQPRRVDGTYSAGSDEPTEARTYAVCAWIVGDATNPREALAWHVLDLILNGNEAAPLRRALLDSKLGEDVVFTGADGTGLDIAYSAGLKGTEPGRVEAFERLACETMEKLAAQGFTPAQVDAALHQAGYYFREIHGGYPLHMMNGAIGSWIFGDDPLVSLNMSQLLDELRERLRSEPGLFQDLLRERVVGNPHRLTLTLRPEPGREARLAEEMRVRMGAARAKLTDRQAEEISAEAARLEELSGQANTPEQLASLPQLKVSDLPPGPRPIPTTVESPANGVTLLVNDVFANGVNYLSLNVDLGALPRALWPILPRYCEAVQKMGAAGQDYRKIAERMTASTGGFNCWFSLLTHASDPHRPVRGLTFSIKTLDDRMEDALALLEDLLFQSDPRDRSRLEEILIQSRAGCRTHLVEAGNVTAALHAGRGFTPAAHLAEITGGLPQLRSLEQLTAGFAAGHAELMSQIEAVRAHLLSGREITASFTGSAACADAVRRRLRAWRDRLGSEAQPADAAAGFHPFDGPRREALAGPVQVAYCVRVLRAPHYSHPDQALLILGARIVGMEYLLSEIRFKGNAYGASCRYDALGSLMTLGSYFDPHIVRTLGVFDSVRDFVRDSRWSQTDIDRAIIGSAKDDDAPIRPAGATGQALTRHLAGVTRQLRQQRYDRLRAATPAQVRRALLDTLDAGYDRGAVCVVSNRGKIEDANRQMPGAELAVSEMLATT
jgi:hypothetical protein